MSEFIPKRLYHLLPDLYRWRDQQQGQPLQAFLAILEQELHTLEVDMEAMYDNWFIQTCDNWTVPYLADLLGIRDQVVQIDYLPFTQRRRVANTLAYRRRKGTVAVLEQVLWDVTNWHIRAVEFYKLLSTTQHLQHLQSDQVVSVNLKDGAALASLESPFSLLPRSGDVRMTRTIQPQAEPGQGDAMAQATQKNANRSAGGKYNPHNLGLFFWRIRPYPVVRGAPKQHAADTPYFSFSPTGHDTQLFNRPQSFLALEQRATSINMPIVLTRAELAADLNAYRKRYQEVASELRPLNTTYYGAERSFTITDIRTIQLFDHEIVPAVTFYLNRGVISDELRHIFDDQQILLSQDITVRTLESDKCWQIDDSDFAKSYHIDVKDGKFVFSRNRAQIVPSNLISADLSDWPSLEQLRGYFGDATNPDLVAVDPEAGRFAFLNADATFGTQDIRVDYTYGFSADVGGGPYPRHYAVPTTWDDFCEILLVTGCQNSPLAEVSAASKVLTANSLSYALTLWNRYAEVVTTKPRTLIRILDNGIYALNSAADAPLCLTEGAELAIVAEDGVQPTLIASETPLTIYFRLPVSIQASAIAAFALPAPIEEEPPIVDRKLLLSGLRIVGGLVVNDREGATLNAFDLVVEHCTLLQGGIAVNLASEDAPALNLTVLRSIVGPLHVPPAVASLEIAESIVDAQLRSATTTAGDNEKQALVGPSTTIRQSTIFGEVEIEGALQADMVLFTHPVIVKEPEQVVPSLLRYCYLPAGSSVPACENCLHEDVLTDHCERCRAPIARPIFSSRRYGRPEYAQLSDLSADEILYGVGNIAEIGAFYQLYQPQREANIQIMLEEFMPLDLDAGVFHVT